MMLEAAASSAAFFVTLTYRLVQYNDNGIPTLDPEHPRNWLKRFRKLYPPNSVRYFLVGEYGSKTLRPHYHVLLFFTTWSLSDECQVATQISESWGLGSIHIGDVTPQSLAYVCSYTVKGLTKSNFFPDGRFPEFARSSKGMGRGAIHEFALSSGEFIPDQFRTLGKNFVVPRYIKRKLKHEYGMVEAPTQEDIQIAELSALRLSAQDIIKGETDSALQQIQAIQAGLTDKQTLSVQRSKIKIQQGLLERDKNETL